MKTDFTCGFIGLGLIGGSIDKLTPPAAFWHMILTRLH